MVFARRASDQPIASRLGWLLILGLALAGPWCARNAEAGCESHVLPPVLRVDDVTALIDFRADPRDGRGVAVEVGATADLDPVRPCRGWSCRGADRPRVPASPATPAFEPWRERANAHSTIPPASDPESNLLPVPSSDPRPADPEAAGLERPPRAA